MSLQGNDSDIGVCTTSGLAGASMATPSWHVWYRNAATPTIVTTGIANTVFSISDATEAYTFGFWWHSDISGERTSFYYKSSGGAILSTQASGSFLADTYYGIGARYDGANVGGFINGSLNVNPTVVAFTAAVNPSPCALATAAGASGFDDGAIAEVGVWNVPLTNDEFAALGKRVSPLLVRRSGLVLYWKLIRGAFADFGPAVSTLGTPSWQYHLPMIYPRGPHTRGLSGLTAALLQPIEADWGDSVEVDHGDESATGSSGVVSHGLEVDQDWGSDLGIMKTQAHNLEVGEEWASGIVSKRTITNRLLAKSRFTVTASAYLNSGRLKERP